MKLNDRGLLIVISGPSGVGKGTVRRALFNMTGHNLIFSISMTTRPPREGEVDGVDYYFVDEETFLKNVKEDKFLEWAKFVGHYYGTPRDKVEDYLELGKEVVLEIEVDGALQFRDKMKEAIFIFIVPPSKEALYQRLVERGTENPELINDRFNKAQNEFLLAYKYDYIVVNDDVANAADKIMAIIRAEHSRTQRSINNYMKMIGEW